jgi:hypothetical protein
MTTAQHGFVRSSSVVPAVADRNMGSCSCHQDAQIHCRLPSKTQRDVHSVLHACRYDFKFEKQSAADLLLPGVECAAGKQQQQGGIAVAGSAGKGSKSSAAVQEM